MKNDPSYTPTHILMRWNPDAFAWDVITHSDRESDLYDEAAGFEENGPWVAIRPGGSLRIETYEDYEEWADSRRNDSPANASGHQSQPQ